MRPRWTYISKLLLNDQVELNELGLQGWELVAVVVSPDTNRQIAYLKKINTLTKG